MSSTTTSGVRDRALGGRIVAAGEMSRVALSNLLGIAALGDPFRVSAVAWLDHALEIAVEVGAEAPMVLRVEARTDESKGLCQTDHLNFFFRERDVPRELAEQIPARAIETMGTWTLEEIAELLQKDPGLGAPGAPMPPGRDESDRPRSLLDTWGSDDAYSDFFAGGEVARGQLDSVDFSRLFRFVQHCDLECTQVNPSDAAPIVPLVNLPWDERARLPLGELPRSRQNEPDHGDADGMITTDLNEDDIILGNPDKLREVLDYATSRPDPDNKPIFFSNTCTPTVIGEDVESMVKQAEAKSGRRIFYLTVTPRSMTTVFQDLLVTRRLRAEKDAGPPDPRAVNLIGFADNRAVDELESLLTEAGIRVNARLLPNLLPEVVDRLPRAAANVIYPNRTWQHFYDQLTFESRIPHRILAPPFGFEGVRRWLGEVAALLELDLDVDLDLGGAWERHVASHADQWEALRERAAGQRVGFVVRDREAYLLTTPGATWGVPILACVEEMGFGIDLLIGVSKRETAIESARTLKASFLRPADHTIRAFDSFAFLRQRLRDSPAAAFFSYHNFDWRLTEAGKPAFSIQHYEPGVPGAVRTLERLLGICGTSYYRRYAKYLRRTPVGLRAEPDLP